ncbi:MAG: UDP-N-acetylmuramoyl-tripeptide--D-alanyl-D-alanine ligase [Myxococcota bacterium]|jgi:UDP-N-acetylmuramoyl-tripeptide--D-alanyl-D-alanine ligase|nr:UDP-N-acetylmuramoyl-tripeptide--D-alanyl-D-alanine ligase [Myxococcota bacterium]
MTEPLLCQCDVGEIAGFMNASSSMASVPPRFTSVSTDSRKLQPGALFFALRGDNFDGHQFVQDAIDKGARGVVVDEACEEVHAHVLLVKDTKKALGALAAAIIAKRRALGTFELYAVTGSNGKTTCKELLAALLSCAGPCLKTSGNLNNDIGMPLVALQLTAEHRSAVLEMGANAPGEIAHLVSLAQPDVCLLSAVAAAHLQGFGSIEGVARAKAEIFSNPRCRRMVFPRRLASHYPALLDDPRTVLVDEPGDPEEPRPSVRVQALQCHRRSTKASYLLGDTQLELEMPLIGAHNALNLGLALAALYDRLPSAACMQEALTALELPGGRLQWLKTAQGIDLLNDAYNANPSSMRAALSTLCAQAPATSRIVVFGEMRELGPESLALHRDLGAAVAAADVRALLCVGGEAARAMAEGALAAGMESSKVTTWTAEQIGGILDTLRSLLVAGDVVLLKASRAMALERVAQGLGARP